jgi:nitroreductase
MKGGLARMTSANSFQRSSEGEGVVFVDVGIGEAVEVEVHQGEAHHVGRDVVALEVLGEAALFVRSELAVALGVGVGAEDVLVGGDEETGGAAGGVEDGLVFLRGEDLDHEINDVARGAELAGVALRAEDAEEILEGVAEALAVVVAELVDDFEEGLERLGVAVREVGVFEDVAEERGDAGVLGHLGNAFAIEAEHLVAAERRGHELGPAVAGVVAGEELALAAEFLGLGIHVIHEFVDERDGDLLDLRFGVGDFADEDVAGGVDAAFGVGVEHGGFL